MSSTRRHRVLGGAHHYRRSTGWVKGTCTWCRRPVAGRALWCGADACLLEYLSRNSPTDPRVKEAVFLRDVGTCRRCGRDLRDGKPLRFLGHAHRQTVEPWELDHVVPVAEGGGDLGLTNLQLLCVPCHKAKTAEQARRRARSAREPSGAQVQLTLLGPGAWEVPARGGEGTARLSLPAPGAGGCDTCANMHRVPQPTGGQAPRCSVIFDGPEVEDAEVRAVRAWLAADDAHREHLGPAPDACPCHRGATR